MTIQRDGTVWIARFSTRSLENAFDKPGQVLQPRLFDFGDGLDGPPTFAYVKNSAARGADGLLWFVTTEGIGKIDSAHMARNTAVPNVVISGIAADRRRYIDPRDLTLERGVTWLEIDCTALSLTMRERVQFRYRLEGLDANCVNPGKRRQAFYTKLEPGKYVFRVIASNNAGVWNRRGAMVRFEILPTFVQSLVFRLLCGPSILLLLWLAYAFRIRRITARLLDA
jgi:hypothetical protein